MVEYPIPLERLRYFQQQLGVAQEELAALESHREAFIARRDEFGQFFWDSFWAIERTRTILEHTLFPNLLQKIKSLWFEGLFKEKLSERFIQYLWSSGVKHVEANLDQRYINLAYALARQFCQKVVREDIEPSQHGAVSRAVDKMLDFCVLVATDSYITMTSRCDRQVIQGIAHQVRNPITVIGGNIRRLQREVEKESPAYRAYAAVLEENQRLERMVKDVSAYTGLFQTDPRPEPVSLSRLLHDALDSLSQSRDMGKIKINLELSPEYDLAFGDPQDLEMMFRHLLENCLEALDPADPRVSITSRTSPRPGAIEIEIFNTGSPPPLGELEELMAPFHSSKPKGTGFGLPIANMVARRNLGEFSLEAGPGGGTICLLRLPMADGRKQPEDLT
jgi:signal transduction histidine kinase